MSEQRDLLPVGPGERLGKARMARKWSLDRVARELKLPVDVVRAIEADELERFAPLYRRGYLLAYARLLGWAPEETAVLFDAEDSGRAPQLQPAYSLAPRPRAGDRWLRAASYALASLLVGTLAWQLTHEVVRLTQEGAEGPAARQAGESPAQPDPARSEQHMTASIAALEELRRPERETAPGEAAWNALRRGPDAQVGEAALAPEEHDLRIQTSGDSWVEITDADGTRLEMDLVRGGSEREYRGQGPFQIVFGRASAVQLSLDGKPVDLAAHTSGGVTQMQLDPAGAGGLAPVQDGGD